ncbi:mannose-1-phosphate guanylyltransferase [Lentisphaerota bacterium WC36G]
MAGGRGERFWPQSRISHPKQLLKLVGDCTLLEQTVNRLGKEILIPSENILILTNKNYVSTMQSLLKNIPNENIIGEIANKDTAPCIALATAIIKKRTKNFDDAVMVVLPADQVTNDHKSLQESLKDAIEITRNNKQMVTIGVKPTFPSTGYGYINCDHNNKLRLKSEINLKNDYAQGVKFIEKPNLKTAEEYIKSKNYRWNSGIFIWSLPTIEGKFAQFTPQLKLFIDLIVNDKNCTLNMIDDYYQELNKISIDYAIMENIDQFIVLECSFDWDDVGSWTSLENQLTPDADNNYVIGCNESLNSNNNIIISNDNHLVSAIGIKDTVIVHTNDATLVCSKDSAQMVKDLVQKLSNNDKMKKFL